MTAGCACGIWEAIGEWMKPGWLPSCKSAMGELPSHQRMLQGGVGTIVATHAE